MHSFFILILLIQNLTQKFQDWFDWLLKIWWIGAFLLVAVVNCLCELVFVEDFSLRMEISKQVGLGTKSLNLCLHNFKNATYVLVNASANRVSWKVRDVKCRT